MNESMLASVRASSGRLAVLRARGAADSQDYEARYADPEMLSPFGEMFERLCREREISKRHLADLAGVSSGKMTETLRDREWALEHGKRWYGPDLAKLEIWADAFGLKGAERADFIDLAHLAHGTRHTKRRFDQLRAEVRSLVERVDALEKKRR